jgi:hypothetical protein
MQEIKLNAFHKRENRRAIKSVRKMMQLPWTLEQALEQQRRLNEHAREWPENLEAKRKRVR